MLDVRRLRVLCAVADHESLRAAADALSYTPSAVSQQIVALEREVGVRVLHRGPKGVKLTATGQLLVEQARPILTRLSAAEAAVTALAGLSAGRLQLASFATAGATILPRAIGDFRKRHPDVAVSLTQADPDAATARLRAGDVDLIIAVDVVQRPNDTIEVVELLEDPFHAVLPSDHPLATRGGPVRLSELADETWVDTPAGSEARRMLLVACGRAGFIPHVAFESDDYATVQQLVATGVGVALIPALALRSSPPGTTVVALETPFARKVMAALHVPEYRAPAAGAMMEILREVAREEPR